jgi:small subunit ribosomal protein S11
MLRLKEFYQQKRDLLKMNKNLRQKVFIKIKKSYRKFFYSKQISHRKQKKENRGIIFVRSSLNNTIVALTNLKGKVQCVQSTGSCGFQGKKKRSTKFAIVSTLKTIAVMAKDHKLNAVFLSLKGFSKSRYYLLKTLKKRNLRILGIRDITPNPHNGCRPKKLRRG